jgi:hypothetical protein
MKPSAPFVLLIILAGLVAACFLSHDLDQTFRASWESASDSTPMQPRAQDSSVSVNDRLRQLELKEQIHGRINWVQYPEPPTGYEIVWANGHRYRYYPASQRYEDQGLAYVGQ